MKDPVRERRKLLIHNEHVDKFRYYLSESTM